MPAVNFADEGVGFAPIALPAKGPAMPLERERATYARELDALLAQAGKFAVIHGDGVAGVYDTYSDALQVGYDKFGLSPFMVKQIERFEHAHFFTRDLGL